MIAATFGKKRTQRTPTPLRNGIRNRSPGVPDTAHPLQLSLRIDIAFRKTLTAACLGHSLHGFNVAAHAVVIALATPSALQDVCRPCVPDMAFSATPGAYDLTRIGSTGSGHP